MLLCFVYRFSLFAGPCAGFFLFLDFCSEEGICSASLKRNLYCFFFPFSTCLCGRENNGERGRKRNYFPFEMDWNSEGIFYLNCIFL